jgi:lipoyl(octanoyl) transferase
MSSEVDRSRGRSVTQCNGIGSLASPTSSAALQPRVRFAPLEMTNPLFAALEVYQDTTPHSAAMNMAIDEALLEYAAITSIRLYRWQSSALSFGYFGKFADIAEYANERDLVRRWTGGGTVFHGDDLTYSIVIPASDPAFAESSVAIYEKIHCALAEALSEAGHRATVAGVDDPGLLSAAVAGPGISDAGYNCFANPVRADVMMDGRKIAGAAQRRTRCGLLQQGSIQGVTLANDLAQRFARALSASCSGFEINERILERAQEVAGQKYGADWWLRKR